MQYVHQRKHVRADRVDFTDLDAETIIAFLSYLEDERGNIPSTRNARLAAIHAVFGYASYHQIQHADLIARVIAIAPKRTARPDSCYLADPEVDALLTAPNTTRWVGRRDQLIIAMLVATGLRISEVTGIRWSDVRLDPPSYLRCHGKGEARATELQPAWLPRFGCRGWTRPRSFGR